MIRYFIAWLVSKLPWMDDEKRAAQKARLAQMQEELERDLEKDAERRRHESARMRRAIAQMDEKLDQPRDTRP